MNIKLKRQISQHLLTIYLPSSFIIVIAQVSFLDNIQLEEGVTEKAINLLQRDLDLYVFLDLSSMTKI